MNENKTNSTGNAESNSSDKSGHAPKAIDEQYDLAHYSALVNSWVQTKMEKDKSVFTLSAGGIGLLITLITALKPITLCQFIVAIFAIAAFVVALFSLLAVFHYNGDHVRRVIKEEETNNPMLKGLDSLAMFAFVIGIVLSFVAGTLFGVEQIQHPKGVYKMNSDQRKPNPDFGKSLNGIAGLKPDSSSQSNGNDSAASSSNQSTSNDSSSPSGDTASGD